ncbi:hypothetical protein C5O00_02660 [Pukyongia salina]|uniref:Uncharacterized protein n=1 Tax=Pukyongia salina TaxID=2094025 RepID=A0A2S0HTY3_9FLAO|nr:hypothetical protein [Pukyongia salina]AVI50129.1 hypothetical protein C5O00_02660 [Pukyongia salina]
MKQTVTAIKETITDSSELGVLYARQELEHMQLKLFYKIASHTSGTAKKVVYGLLLLMTMTFSSIALALYLGTLLNSTALGFLVVSGMYILLIVTAFLLRRKIEKYIINELAQNFFDS